MKLQRANFSCVCVGDLQLCGTLATHHINDACQNYCKGQSQCDLPDESKIWSTSVADLHPLHRWFPCMDAHIPPNEKVPDHQNIAKAGNIHRIIK
jgi:hypothetical protein